MNNVLVLTRRNVRLFLRDRATVFFSFLSTLILVMLYFMFIAKIYAAGMDDPQAGGIAVSIGAGAKNFIVYIQMMAGVLILNSMSLATGAFSTIAKDFEDKRIDSFFLTPVKIHEVIFSYYMTGFLSSFVINTFTWGLSFALIGILTGYWLAAGTFLTVLVILLIASLVSCSIMLLFTAMVKSSAAIGVINGISGTFFGFLCGIYMPYSNLGESTKAVGSLFPFSHLTIWLKQTVLGDAFSQLQITGEFKEILLSDYFSARSIGFITLSVSLRGMVLYSVFFGIICLMASYALLHRRMNFLR